MNNSSKLRSFKRRTKQRKMILEELKDDCSHPTAAELYKRIRQKLPNVSLGTIYRNLDLLVTEGAVQKLVQSGEETRFDSNPDHHYHVRCNSCGRVDDIFSQMLDFGELTGNHILNSYKVLGHKLEFNGLCSDCHDQS